VAKSYVPRMLFLARMLSVYLAKHQTTIFRYVTDPTQQAAISNCSACLTSLLNLIQRPTEQP
jgi:hypothetical protein